MHTSSIEPQVATAVRVDVGADALVVELSDGRVISVPMAWYPRLGHASDSERGNWRFIGEGRGIHWTEIDEDISVENLLAGKHSGESQLSFKRWLESRSNQIPSA